MQLTSERITSNTSFYIIALTTQKVLALVYFILIARFLGAEDIGRYALAISFIHILSIFIDIGFSPSITRESSRDSGAIKRYFSDIIGFKILMSMLTLLILYALANLFGYSLLVKQLLYLAGIVMILDSFTLTFYAMLRGLHILNKESIGVIVYQVIVIFIALTGLYSGLSVHILIVALIAGSSFNFIWALHSLKKYTDFKISISFNWNSIKPFFKIALPFGVTAIFIKLYQMGDTVLLSLLSTEKELGWYSVSHKLVFAFEFIPLAFMATIFPAMSSFFKSDREKMQATFEKSSYYLMLIAMPLMFGGFVLAKPLMLALYGEGFLPSVLSLKILLLSLLFIFLNYPLSSLLAAINRQRMNMYFMGIAAFLSIVLNSYLIPRFGGAGAASALLISLTVLFIVYIVYIRVRVLQSLRNYCVALVKIVAVAAVMALFVSFISTQVIWWLSLLIGIFVYIVLLAVFKLITLKEFKNIYAGIRITK